MVSATQRLVSSVASLPPLPPSRAEVHTGKCS